MMARMKTELPVADHDSEQPEPEWHDKHSDHFPKKPESN